MLPHAKKHDYVNRNQRCDCCRDFRGDFDMRHSHRRRRQPALVPMVSDPVRGWGSLMGILAAILAVFVVLVFALIAYAAYLTHDPHDDAREKFALLEQAYGGQLRKKQLKPR
jgi:hypothetical protein